MIVDNDPGKRLSIADLADRTGVPAATLRSWEARFAFPVPLRLPSGHRRYDEADVARVERVVRERAAGIGLPAAIDRAKRHVDDGEESVFAGLRSRHPELTVQVLRKATVLSLTRAIEDECCARAERPVIFACFQRQDYFTRSRPRWLELARTARAVVVFADFSRTSNAGQAGRRRPALVPLPVDAPLRREWILVCQAPEYPACLVGWERAGQDGVADEDRVFETLWSLDPRTVLDATRLCWQLAGTWAPRLRVDVGDALTQDAQASSADLQRATDLLSRMVTYLDHVR